MAKKKFETLQGSAIYPSKVDTIEILPNDESRFRVKLSLGLNRRGKPIYSESSTDTIQFQKTENDNLTPGWTEEQVIMVLINRIERTDISTYRDERLKGLKFVLNSYIEEAHFHFDK